MIETLDPIMQLPGVYGGVRVPHYEQYLGVYAMELSRFDALAANIRASNADDHIAQRNDEREKRIAAGLPTRTWRDEAELDAHGYQIVADDVAIVDLNGVMTKYGGSFSSMPGGVIGLRRTLRGAVSDPAVKAIVLRTDSPGGSVAGADDLADDVRRINAVKPIVAFIEDIGASAGYYVPSQAGMIVAGKGSLIGSIGVYMVVDDWSAAFATEGVKRHVIRSGKFKGAGVPGTEITPTQLADFQREIDELHAVFVDAVSAGREMAREQVADLADGRIHIASRAKELGLIDQIGTLEDAVKEAKKRIDVMGSDVGPMRKGLNDKEKSMSSQTDATVPPRAATLAELKKAIPDAGADFREECLEMEATVADAKDLWGDRLRAKVQAQGDEIAAMKAAAKSPGVDPVASGGTSGHSETEASMIADAVKASGGDRVKGIAALQRELKKPMLDAGFTNRAANTACAAKYPTIFGM